MIEATCSFETSFLISVTRHIPEAGIRQVCPRLTGQHNCRSCELASFPVGNAHVKLVNRAQPNRPRVPRLRSTQNFGALLFKRFYGVEGWGGGGGSAADSE
jgi:hypothetical protein